MLSRRARESASSNKQDPGADRAGRAGRLAALRALCGRAAAARGRRLRAAPCGPAAAGAACALTSADPPPAYHRNRETEWHQAVYCSMDREARAVLHGHMFKRCCVGTCGVCVRAPCGRIAEPQVFEQAGGCNDSQPWMVTPRRGRRRARSSAPARCRAWTGGRTRTRRSRRRRRRRRPRPRRPQRAARLPSRLTRPRSLQRADARMGVVGHQPLMALADCPLLSRCAARTCLGRHLLALLLMTHTRAASFCW